MYKTYHNSKKIFSWPKRALKTLQGKGRMAENMNKFTGCDRALKMKEQCWTKTPFSIFSDSLKSPFSK